MNVYRLVGVDGESVEASTLWSLGCMGLVEEVDAEGVPSVLAYFAEHVDLPFAGTWETRPDVDHVAIYQAGLDPVRVGHLVVAPSHATVTATDGDQIIWLDPGSAFGTGHHETTAMALAALIAEPGGLAGKTVIDVGSGTGLLAIAADLLGAEASYGVDVDPITVPVARANAARNRSRARFALGSVAAAPAGVHNVTEAGVIVDPVDRAVAGLPSMVDVVVANLYAELHAVLFEHYAGLLMPGGAAYLTGILESRREVVMSAVPATMRLRDERQDGEWLLLSFEKLP